MINPRVLYWDDNLEIARELRRTRLLVRPVTWKRVLRGDVSLARWATMARWLAERAASVRACAPRAEPQPSTTTSIVPQRSIVCATGSSRAVRLLRRRAALRRAHPRRAARPARPLADRLPGSSCPAATTRCVRLWMHEHVVAAMDAALDAELCPRGRRRERCAPSGYSPRGRNSSVWSERNFVGNYATRVLCGRRRSCCCSAMRNRSAGACSSSAAVRDGSRATSARAAARCWASTSRRRWSTTAGAGIPTSSSGSATSRISVRCPTGRETWSWRSSTCSACSTTWSESAFCARSVAC